MKTQKITLSFTCILVLLFATTLVAQKDYQPVVKKSVFFGKSKAIRDVTIVLPGTEKEMKEVDANPLPQLDYDRSQITQDRLVPENVQDYCGPIRAKGPSLNFEGVPNVNGGWPADPNGDVGLNHYVQSVNNSTAFWDKAGNLLYGPIDNKTIFNAFPGPWHLLNWSDPVIVYDAQADRWVFSSMSLKLDQSPYYEMVAVSVSPDPLGEYYCYAYEFEHVNDYPKMSVWPNGYYLTYNIFEYSGDWNFLYSLVSAVDREAMLAGDSSATMVQFELEPPAGNVIRMSPLTADLNGTMLPDDPECFVVIPEYKMQGFPWETNLDFYSMEPDWETPENSVFDSVTQINVEGIFPTFWETNAPQPGNFHDVEPINFYLMYPLAYRHFNEYEVMVGCHTLYDGEQHYIRWYEFRKDTANWYIYQSGNYMPDSASRYVPSISMNGKGDIAMVFTKSSLEIYPSMCATGRRAGDSSGMMTIRELEIWKGLNYVNNYSSSNGRNRWGDYASMMVDPVDDSTFWFTSMYPLAQTYQGNWSTRIAAMNLAEATDAPIADAGPDTTICGYESFKTHGEAVNYSSVLWETGGDGVFSDPRKLEASYLRGNGDLENGQVSLKLTVTGYEPGTGAADSMTLYLNSLPQVDAGPDDTICVNQSYACQGEVAYADTYYWTCTGAGTFNDSTLLDAIYTPVLSDTVYQWLIFTLHAEPLYPCDQGNNDQMLLHTRSCLGVDEMSDGIALRIYPNPSSGMVTVQAEGLGSGDATIHVLQSTGQLIFSGECKPHAGTLKKQFDFSKLSSGVYYVKLISEQHEYTRKLIIQ